MLDGWERLSPFTNSLYIDRARYFCQKHISQKFDDEYKCTLMEVYSQVVNGKNFKVLILGKNRKTNEFKCFTAITWLPANPRPEPEFKEDTFKVIDGTTCTLNAEKEGKLKGSIKAYFKEEKDFTPIQFFENVIDSANVYVLKVGDKFAGAFEVGEEIKIDCTLN